MKIDFTKEEITETISVLHDLKKHYSILYSCYQKNEYMNRQEKEKKAYEIHEKIKLTNQLIDKMLDGIICPFE